MDIHFVRVGFVRKAHRFAGAVRIEIDEQYIEAVLEASFLFIEVEGCKIPFAVERFEVNQSLVVHFENVLFPDDTDQMIGGSIYLEGYRHDQQDGPKVSGQDLVELQALVGFCIRREAQGKIGIIDKIEQYPGQMMATVITGGREILIPWVDAFIVSIEWEKKEVLVDLPDGLV